MARATGRLLLSFAVIFTLMVPSALMASAAAYAADSSSAATASGDAYDGKAKQEGKATKEASSASVGKDDESASNSKNASEKDDEDAGATASDAEQAKSGNKDDKVKRADDSEEVERSEDFESPKSTGDSAEDLSKGKAEPADGEQVDESGESTGAASASDDAVEAESVDEKQDSASEKKDAVLSAGASAKGARALSASRVDRGSAQIESAYLLMMNPKTKEYERFGKTTEGKPQKVAAVRDEAFFDVQLTYGDGTVRRASKADVKVTWKLDNNVHAGKEVVSINADGKMTISGVSTKLVQLKASVEGVKVEGSPAYINLVSDTDPPDSGKTVDSIAVSYAGSGEGASSGTMAPAADTASAVDGVAEEDVPAITEAGGSLSLSARVTTVGSSGNKTTTSGAAADAQLAWQIVALYDEFQERADVIIAALQQNGQNATLTATQAGNGWVTVRCASSAYPDFAGQEILVRIAGNAAISAATVAANTIADADLAYKDSTTGSYKDYAGTIASTPTVIDTPGGSASFDARLTFANGSTALASQRGLAVDYALAGIVSAGAVIAKMAPDGMLSATNQKNGTVRITGATVNGSSVDGTPAYVRISGNDASIRPASDSLDISALSNYWVGASQRPDDASQNWRWRAVPTSGSGSNSVPLIVSTPSYSSSCKLSASIRWNNSTVTTSQEQDGGVRTWSVVKSTDYDGKACSTLVTVGGDGAVRPVGAKNGYATVRCTVDLPVYNSAGKQEALTLTGEYKVAVYASESYVKKIVLLDDKGLPIKTSAIKLASGKNAYNFAALVTYVGFDEESHSVGEYEVNTKIDPQKAVGLEWRVYRSEERAQEELYSKIRQDGSFLAQSGFARGYVYACIPHGSFTGKDIGVGVNVIAEDSIEYLGHTDSITVMMYHYSDYLNHGDGAKPAKEVTLTRSQLEGLADYTTWYTFQRREAAFSTVYARGLTMRTLLAVCGVDPDRLISMAFTGTDGYFAERHSANFILGTQYRYTNYYYHKDLPGLVGSQSVSPMLALSYYMKNNAGYEDASDKSNAGEAGYGYMSSDSTFRVIFGMKGIGIRNANQSVSNVSSITIIVEDNTFPPDEEEEDSKPDKPDNPDTPSDEQNGTPGNQGNTDGGESANPFSGQSDEGVGTDAKQGGTVAVSDDLGDAAEAGEKDASNDRNDDKGSASGQSTQDSDVVQGEVDQSGNPLIRELRENPKPVLPPAKIDAIWWMLVTMAALAALFFGGMFSRRRYVVDRADGVMIQMKSP